MSPRPADPALREALVAAAARVLAAEGRAALTTRRLATEVGASTMAVYTRFGSMDELHQAVRQDGFTRLGTEIDAVPGTADPVTDLAALGLSYFANGLANPELYRAMFLDRPPGYDDAGTGVFDQHAAAIRRCVDAGRFNPTDPPLLLGWAGQVWVTNHGMVTLALTGLMPPDQITFLLTDMTYRLAVGYGDHPDAARRSIDNARASALAAINEILVSNFREKAPGAIEAATQAPDDGIPPP